MTSWADLPIAQHSKEIHHQSQLSPRVCLVEINHFRGSSGCQDYTNPLIKHRHETERRDQSAPVPISLTGSILM